MRPALQEAVCLPSGTHACDEAQDSAGRVTQKQDTMLSGLGTDTAGTVQLEIGIGAADDPQFIAACMTYMRRTNGADDMVRQNKEIYFVGWKDIWRFHITGGSAFIWRRIVFSSYEQFEFSSLPGNGVQGYMRNIQPNGIPTTGGDFDMIDELFSGTKGIDWADPMTAPVDTHRVRVMSDRKMTLLPRNDTGYETEQRRWQSVKKRLVYDDDEIGDDMEGEAPGTNSSPWSAEQRGSVGNVYCVDFSILWALIILIACAFVWRASGIGMSVKEILPILSHWRLLCLCTRSSSFPLTSPGRYWRFRGCRC